MRTQRSRFCFILVFALLTISSSYELDGAETQRRTSFRYNFKYLGMTVAKGDLTISDTLVAGEIQAKCIKTHATSLPATSVLFRIHNTYSTLIDAETGLPIHYTKDIEQSNITEASHFHFDQHNMRIDTDGGKALPLLTPTHTFFSALYSMMNHSFQPKEVLCLPVYAAGGLWEVMAKAIAREKVITPVGTYTTVLIEIEFQRHPDFQITTIHTDVLTNRLLREGVKTYLWFSTDPKGILVKGEYELFPARLQMILSNVQR